MTSIAYGKVTATLVSVTADGPDVGYAPDEIPVSGTIRFTPTVSHLRFPDRPGARIAVSDRITCPVIDGQLYPPEADGSGEPGVYLAASDQPRAEPNRMQYRVEFFLTNATNPAPFLINVPTDDTCDLAEVMPQAPQPGVITVVTTTDRLAAEAAATQAAALVEHLEELIEAGTPGPPGLDADITSITATGLAAGAAPTATLGGTPQARTIALGIPKGDTGAAGADAGITSVTATGLAAGAAPTVTMGGTAQARTIALGIPKGDKGDTGDGLQTLGGQGVTPVPTFATLTAAQTWVNSYSPPVGTIVWITSTSESYIYAGGEGSLILVLNPNSGLDASKLTTGTLPAARIADGAITAAKLATDTTTPNLTMETGWSTPVVTTRRRAGVCYFYATFSRTTATPASAPSAVTIATLPAGFIPAIPLTWYDPIRDASGRIETGGAINIRRTEANIAAGTTITVAGTWVLA